MATKRNPKQVDSNLFDCRPQTGLCPNRCNQCFFNRPGAFYNNIDQPSIPSPEEVGTGIVRMNCGHDSNIERDLVIETAKQYENVFFNTSISNLDFPGPVVLTANPREEESYVGPQDFWARTAENEEYETFDNLMFVRLRVSPTNLKYIENAVEDWTINGIPVVLTFMAYYDSLPPNFRQEGKFRGERGFYSNDGEKISSTYTWQKRHINSYWCATEEFMKYVTMKMKKIGSRLVSRCGSTNSRYCKDCRNCAIYYWRTVKHLAENI